MIFKESLEHAESVSGEPIALFFIKINEHVLEASDYSHIIRRIIVERCCFMLSLFYVWRGAFVGELEVRTGQIGPKRGVSNRVLAIRSQARRQ